MKKKKTQSINREQRNSNPLLYILISFATILLLAGIVFVVITPYLKTLPVYKTFSHTYTVEVIDDTSHLESDGSFILSSKNSLENNETLTLSSEDLNVEIGPLEPKAFIYADKGDADSNVIFKFTEETDKEIKDIIYTIYLCDEDGSNVVKTPGDDLLKNEDGSVTVKKDTNIFVNRVSVSYTLRVKN